MLAALPAPAAAQVPAVPGEAVPGAAADDTNMTEWWTSGRYRLTSTDVVELIFPYVPEFNQTLIVHPDGYVTLRGVGDIRVAGRSLPELRTMVLEAYERILREPVVTIILREFEKPFFVAHGEVKNPGRFEMRGMTTVTQALALAGGITGSAKHSQVVLFRRFANDLLEVKEVDVKRMLASRDLSEDPLLRPGDILFVPRSVLSRLTPYIPVPGLGVYLNPFSR
jgi:polysaccharide export outer membrane protein